MSNRRVRHQKEEGQKIHFKPDSAARDLEKKNARREEAELCHYRVLHYAEIPCIKRIRGITAPHKSAEFFAVAFDDEFYEKGTPEKEELEVLIEEFYQKKNEIAKRIATNIGKQEEDATKEENKEYYKNIMEAMDGEKKKYAERQREDELTENEKKRVEAKKRQKLEVLSRQRAADLKKVGFYYDIYYEKVSLAERLHRFTAYIAIQQDD
eukprot:4160969-Amphidinium_carterae.3